VLPRPGNLVLPHKIAAPMPSGRDLAAEKQLELEMIGGVADLIPFRIQRRVAEDLSPVGQRPTQFDLLLRDRETRVCGPLFVSNSVEIELQATGEAELDFILRFEIRRPVAIFG